jgi:hypothetical protein
MFFSDAESVSLDNPTDAEDGSPGTDLDAMYACYAYYVLMSGDTVRLI